MMSIFQTRKLLIIIFKMMDQCECDDDEIQLFHFNAPME